MHACELQSTTRCDAAEVACGDPCSHSFLVLQGNMHELVGAGVVGVLDLRTTAVPVATGGDVAKGPLAARQPGDDFQCALSLLSLNLFADSTPGS